MKRLLSMGFARVLAGGLLDRAGDIVRGELDDLAFLWIMGRRGYPRVQVLELLEELASRVGAKLEIPDGPGL